MKIIRKKKLQKNYSLLSIIRFVFPVGFVDILNNISIKIYLGEIDASIYLPITRSDYFLSIFPTISTRTWYSRKKFYKQYMNSFHKLLCDMSPYISNKFIDMSFTHAYRYSRNAYWTVHWITSDPNTYMVHEIFVHLLVALRMQNSFLWSFACLLILSNPGLKSNIKFSKHIIRK